MKHTKQIATLLAVAIIASLCQPTVDTSAASIKISKTKIQLTQGKTTTLKVKGTKKKAKWSIKSGKKYIKLQKKRKASVKIKALKVGTAKVQCKVGKKKLACKVTVKAKEIKPKATPQTSLQPTVAPTNSPAQTSEPTKGTRPTHMPTEDRLMKEPLKRVELPREDENGFPIWYSMGDDYYYFFGSDIKRTLIEKVVITNTTNVSSNALGVLDVSEKQNKSVLAWYEDDDNDRIFEMTIGQEGGVIANSNSDYLFCDIQGTEAGVVVEGLEYLYTNEVISMKKLFQRAGVYGKKCYVDLGDYFDTSKVTDMTDIFNWAAFSSTDNKLRFGAAFSMMQVTQCRELIGGFDHVYVPNEQMKEWLIRVQGNVEEKIVVESQ